jgi:peptide/nickel transport system ATP-binding protein
VTAEFVLEEVETASANVPLLDVRDLTVSFPSESGRVAAVRGVSYSLTKGKVLGIVGESGSGKSVSSLAVMGLLPDTAQTTGSVRLNGVELLGRGDRDMSKIRGNVMSMVFQDPLSALTPVYTIGDQLAEAVLTHRDVDKKTAHKRAVELLDLVGIPNAAERVRAFPHEFSGGMRQRVMIAMAVANDPDLIIADEPTTALDVTIQAQILDVFKTAQEVTGAAVVLITHDLGVVAGFADEVLVMYAGKPVETAPVDELFSHPRMPYTIGLLGSIPRLDAGRGQPLTPIEGTPPSLVALPPGCPFTPRCPARITKCSEVEPELLQLSPIHSAACHRAREIQAGTLPQDEVFPTVAVEPGQLERTPREQRDVVLEVHNLVKHFPLTKGAVFRRTVGAVHAVDGISFDIREGETLALVGESGCGKTTTIMEILSLLPPMEGTVAVLGKQIVGLSRQDRMRIRRDLQVVFQDPMASLDPRLPVSDIIAEPLRTHGWSREKTDQRVRDLLVTVGLDPKLHLARFPSQFSGGQRQRIAIARALALNPRLIVLDEPVSALDVSIQAGVLNLLEDLRAKMGLSYLFVAHDLSVVRHISDRVAVMYLGRIVELGFVEDVFTAPSHPYTQALLSAIPIPDPAAERSRTRILLSGDLPSPANPPDGCRFRSRCPLYARLPEDRKQRCVEVDPALMPLSAEGKPTALLDARVDGAAAAAEDDPTGRDHLAACHWARALDVV